MTTHKTGTTTVGITWTSSNTSTDINQLKITKVPVNIPAKSVISKKDFWDGIKWEEHTSYFPRKSITGKIIIGKMYKRSKEGFIKRPYTDIQYAKTRELFEEKLRGKA